MRRRVRRAGIVCHLSSAPEETNFPPRPEPDGARVEARELLVFARVVEGGENLGTVYLRADYELYDRVGSYAAIALVVLMVAMGVAWLTSMRLQRRVTGPILAIATVARGVGRSRLLAPCREDERRRGRHLGRVVNDMLSEIERRVRRTRRR